ncbi:MAG: ATP-binding protein, partial [Desulfobulbaceae bacterium]|nr:ATP-binding protein [Desulfobulbaceae bacterium]
RKHAQDSVRKNEARLRVILDSVPIGIFIVDRDKRTITYANPAAASMIGAESPVVLHGSQCHSYFCEKNTDNCPCLDKDAGFDQADITLQRLDGSPLSVLKTIIPLTIADRPCLLESITDITELTRMSSQNQALQEQLLQSQKMEAVGVLAGGVAHDFNNLLTIIQGSAELAMLATDEERAEFRYLGQIKETTERAGNLVRQLLLFSRTQPMTLSVLSLNNVVENLLKMLKRLIGEDVDVITELDDDIWPMEGNAANIEQLVMNLTVNGRDAMENGGKLYIRTRNVEFTGKSVPATVPEARPGRFVCLEVQDSGGGIAKETLKHIFEPFFTTKEAGKGTGLGLAVVYGIVKQHDGWIDVASEEGQGTSFKIYLPCSTAGLDEEEKASDAVVLRGDGRRVLVVEDEDTLRDLIADTLEHNGFKVFQAVNVAEALEIFEQEKGKFDLLFSDVVLPGEQNGIQLADVVQGKRPEMPVILSSGYTDQKSQWSIIDERGFAFLQKPFNIGELGRMVYDVLEKGEQK